MLYTTGVPSTTSEKTPSPLPSSCKKGVIGYSDSANGTCLYDGAMKSDPFDKTAYYECCQRTWYLKNCVEGFSFDGTKLECVQSDKIPTKRQLLPTTSSQICFAGDKQKNQFDDSKFDECIDGTHWETKTCSSGFRFNSITKQCQIVPTTAACVHGEKRKMPSGDSSKYMFCDGNGWKVRECSTDYLYDQYQKKCVQKHTTRSPNHSISTKRPSEPCRESAGQDGYKPNPADCRTFYQCDHGKWVKRDCGPGTQWSQSILGCDHYTGC
ncbi:hypothetical protein CAEBREN_10772 [Caenorhabditis brenneri]|uniref:Chitin-binding type-2 domain-containing protein n=1 Tax=Caenorhabditis brenneri TaxID=135651 RepID=G0MNI7_CAEBE|nr:hypothetical protein CAEBREN_10772 [Caenorhabditis brenneri]